MTRKNARPIAGLLAAVLFAAAVPCAAAEDAAASAAADTAAAVTAADADDAPGYRQYLAALPDADTPAEPIRIDAAQGFAADEKAAWAADDPDGSGRRCLLTAESGTVSWRFTVPRTGLYALVVRYRPVTEMDGVTGKSSAAQRKLTIDGALPFDECRRLTFERIWADDLDVPGQFSVNGSGDQVRPSQKEVPQWTEKTAVDPQGYTDGALLFYLTEGEHTLAFSAVREPLLLDTLTFCQAEMPVTEVPDGAVSAGAEIRIQGEAASRKSEQTLVPRSDRASSFTQPYSLMHTVQNYIGGTSWSANGQWIEWDFTVEQAGLYVLELRFKQQEKRGLDSCRRITIDGASPGEGWDEVAFSYKTGWQVGRPCDADGRALTVYLTAGKHTLRMENVLGGVRDAAESVSRSAEVLGEVYRQVLMVVGNTPDTYRDYQIAERFPQLADTFKEHADSLREASRLMADATGGNSSLTAILDKVVDQLDRLSADPEKIAKKGNFDALKTNVGSLSSWVQQVAEQPLSIDWLRFCPPEAEQERAVPGFFTRLLDQIRQIFVTYVRDYNDLGSDGDGQRITVWFGSGRDQAGILKTMIDDGFTTETGIGVDLKLIDPATVLMSAILSGNAPDVAMGIQKSTPVNYALRGAVCDLSGFDGFAETLADFDDSAVLPFRFGGGTYALPETETWFMLFTRDDVLREQGLAVPQTWDDIDQAVTVLQRNNLEVALADPGTVAADLLYSVFLYQNGGTFYTADGRSSALTEEPALAAFKQWTDYYTLQGFPISYDAASRFRRGEIPVLIADYALYNTLVVSAPEVAGKWSMHPIPGTRRADGTIDRSEGGSSTGCILLAGSEAKEEAWTYMRWWVRADTQATFGRELESVLGEAARYATANRTAREKIAWSSDALAALQEQSTWVRGIPEVAGSYFTPRHIENAFRFVTNNDSNARDALADRAEYIDEEIRQKRREFLLDAQG